MRIIMLRTTHPLRRHRQLHGLSCQEFARHLGIAEATLRSLENGVRRITPERALEIERRTHGALRRQDLLPEFFEVTTEKAA